MAESKRTLLTLVSLLGAIHFIWCGDSVLSILRASKDAVESLDVEKNMEVVNKYYFTTLKEQSVWYHAIKEGHETYGTVLSTEDLLFIGKLIQSAASHYQTCLKLLPGVNKAQCFFHLSSSITDLEVGVRWELALDYKLRPDQGKYGIIYTSVGMLSAHLSLIAADTFRFYNNVRTSKLRVKPFLKTLNKAQSMLYNYVKDVKIWLLDQVSPATICQMTEILWKEFQQSCETRWVATAAGRAETTRSVINDAAYSNMTQAYTVNNDSSIRRANIVVMPESPEIMKEEPTGPSFESDYLNMEDRSVLKILDEFGGAKGKSEIKFRVQVVDYIEKKVIFEKRMSANPTSKGPVMDTLSRYALEARSRYMEDFGDKLEITKETAALTQSVLLSAVIRIKNIKGFS